MTNHIKRSLFGGALLAAGLTAPAANAQFNFTQSYGATAAYDAFSGQLDTDTFAGAGPFGISSYVGDGYGFAYAFADLSAGPTSIDSNVIYTFDSFTYAGSYLLTYLTASNALGSVTWDFMDQGFINIYEDTGGGFNLVFQNAGNSGTSPFTWNATSNYAIEASAINAFVGAQSSWHIVLPAPGSAGALCLAGLAATRRRRR